MKKMLLLTLASNGKKVAVACDNIAFVIETDSAAVSRVFLKQVVCDENSKWIDVSESPETIAKLMR